LRSKKIPHLVERSGSFAWEQNTRRELSDILESSDAFFAVDRGWRFTYVNREAEKLWGRSREELLGKIVWEGFPQAADSEQYWKICRAMEERAALLGGTLAVSSALGRDTTVTVSIPLGERDAG